ncbi:MAG: DUF1624 domain-containing protein [Bacteroidetes bacterium]|nr:DUF1624 domain-containing protein [Bacteroidota bacterium]
MNRIPSIDFTRGLVMIIMALDHVRDFMHVTAGVQSPTDLSTTTPALFFTRWITYLCAPVFVFLSGTSVYISLQRKENLDETRKFLLTRGVWLVVLEFTVVNFGLWFDVGFHTLIFEVIAAIGVGFIILAMLLKYSAKAVGIIGLVIIGGHNLLPLIPFSDSSILRAVIAPLFGPTVFSIAPGTTLIMGYPPIPWLGIMLVGFSCGRFFNETTEYRQSLFFKVGLSAIALFFVLRFINLYGDALPWSTQKDSLFTFLSFMNVTKYPPSLQFCLITLGIMFLILAVGERLPARWASFAFTYGRVPLFYFVVHFYIAHVVLLFLLLMQGFSWEQFSFANGGFGRPTGVTSGVSLTAIYLLWMSIVLALYKPCVWYGWYKATHNYWWLRYL